jgi:ABC-2 type transport system permease protein
MAATRLVAAIAKEVRLILRDREALLFLFAMPLVFVLIMSLALRDSFHERAGVQFALLVVNQDSGKVGEKLVDYFRHSSHFKTDVQTTAPDMKAVDGDLRTGKYKFAILIPKDTTARAARRISQQLDANTPKTLEPPIAVQLLTDPEVRGDQRALVMASLNRALQSVETAILLQQVNAAGKRLLRARQLFPEIPAIKAPAALNTFVDITDASSENSQVPTPTSVQQNAPAWTLLAMFLLVIPMSMTLIKERQLGSLQRLQSIAVPPWLLLIGKTVPYFVINQLQLLLILLEGMYLLPHLSGEALTIGHAPFAIFLVSAGASLAAIGFGLLIAVFVRTNEQATVFGPVSVLILAAIGGIMVPRFVMPPLMQHIGNLSPLAWALDGFLDIFLREGGVREVLPEVARLFTFAAACFGIATWRFRRYFRQG